MDFFDLEALFFDCVTVGEREIINSLFEFINIIALARSFFPIFHLIVHIHKFTFLIFLSSLLVSLLQIHLNLHLSQAFFLTHNLVYLFIYFTVIFFFDLVADLLKVILLVRLIKLKFLRQSISHSTLNICFL